MVSSNARRFKAVGPIVIFVAVAFLAVHSPWAVRHVLEATVALWWNHLVPILFPGYALAAAVLSSRLQKSPTVPLILTGFLTFPALSGALVLDAVKREHMSPQTANALLLFTNLYNPWLFPDPRLGLIVDIGLFSGALILKAFPTREPVSDYPPAPRSWIIDAMNWTAIFGAAMIFASLLMALLPGLRWHILLEPITSHWIHPGDMPSLGALLGYGLNGFVFLVPILYRTHTLGLSWSRILGGRLLQALVGALVVVGFYRLIL